MAQSFPVEIELVDVGDVGIGDDRTIAAAGLQNAPVAFVVVVPELGDVDELRALVTPKTKLIIFNSPHNPTGGVLTREDITAIADIAREHDITVLADEIYGRGVFEGEHFSIATLPGMAERTIVLDGFSKAWAMTGWRLGFAILPPALEDMLALELDALDPKLKNAA